MNTYQIAYLLALAALTWPAWGRQRYAMGWLWANLAATLAACLAMDLGLMGRDGATVSMLTIDLISGVALSLRPGISRLIAWGYAITVPLYFMNLAFGMAIDATYGFIYIAATAQMGVLVIGCGFGSGGGGLLRRFADRFSVVSSRRDQAPSGAVVSRDFASDRVAE